MIEKLEFTELGTGESDLALVAEPRPATPSDMHWKINEIIDAINELQNKLATVSKMEKTETPAENSEFPNSQENVQDPANWIGELCRVWDDDRNNIRFAILAGINTKSNYPFRCDMGDRTVYMYKHCEPVRPDDDIIYKGE